MDFDKQVGTERQIHIATRARPDQEQGFTLYTHQQQQLYQRAASRGRHAPRLIVEPPVLVKLTKDIVETFRLCNPSYTFSETISSKRILTTPSVPAFNGSLDNDKADLILAVNDVLTNKETGHRYIVKDLLGQGTFGQVAKCWTEDRGCSVAVKIIKNQLAYHQQANVEVSILDMLNSKYDPHDNHQIVRMIEYFYHQDHLCIVFEMLGVSLFDLLKANGFKGLSLNLIRTFTKQILKALALLREAAIIHCDLKPENILLTTSPQSAKIKLIDFGSACREDRTVYSYIQSRFYRSPEVILGHAYTTAIDMWSLGCVAGELFLGLPLFPAQSQYDLLQRLMKVLGGQPPDIILKNAKNAKKYFKVTRVAFDDGDRQQSSYQFLTPDEYTQKEKEHPVIGKHYFPSDWDLERLITGYPMKQGMTSEEIRRENNKRLVFVDFLKGLVEMNPMKRWTPNQAEQHPFITEAPFTGPFKPPPDVTRLPVRQFFNWEHNPATGHWFGAGLSPQVGSNTAFQASSPQHQGLCLSYGSSYAGSYGSCVGDMGAGPGSSFGSNNGESVDSHYNYRTPPNVNLAVSSDVWRRKGHKPSNAYGYGNLGMSPSGGSFIASLGASPSNLGSPTSHFQASPGSSSIASSSRFGPTSPARTTGASSLGKAAALGQYKRRGWGSPGSIHSESHNPTQESSFTSWLTHEGRTESVPQNMLLDSPRSPSYVSQFRTRNTETAGSSNYQVQNSDAFNHPADSSGDPGDWDPNYSEELLFDGDDASSNVSAVTNLLEGTGLKSPRNPNHPNNVGSPSTTRAGQQNLQYHPVTSTLRPVALEPIYVDGASATSRWNSHNRALQNHHQQSRLGQRSAPFGSHQQQNLFQSLNMPSNSFVSAHSQFSQQFLVQNFQASVSRYPMPGMPIHNSQMNPVEPPHWGSGFPGALNDPLTRGFQSIRNRDNWRTDV
ncbi:hypothetical protein KP509_1Z121600 [Ceratopteris richardii]|nr:hypothetical protein KP509_1Z121600 [Ceratopteris richardii]